MPFKNLLLALALSAALLAGCAAQPAAPHSSPTRVPTRTAPVATATPPPSATPAPTQTPRPTWTAQPTATSTPTQTCTPAPTRPPAPTFDPTLASFQDSTLGNNVAGLGTARLLITNHTSAAQINVIVKGVTLKRAQPVYYETGVTRSAVIEILWGSYQILVQIPGRGSLTAAFVQRGKDKTTLIVEKDKLTILGP